VVSRLLSNARIKPKGYDYSALAGKIICISLNIMTGDHSRFQLLATLFRDSNGILLIQRCKTALCSR
jgi:hypothetical protein